LLKQSSADWNPLLLPIFLLIIVLDVVYVMAGPHRFTRVAPAVGLTGLWLGPQTSLACLFGLLVGTLIILAGHSKVNSRVVEAAGRSLLPFALPPLFLSGSTDPTFAQLLFALQAYLVLALVLPAKDSYFRFDLLLLLSGPGLSLAAVKVMQSDPRLTFLLLPLLLALSSTREDSVDMVGRLRHLLGLAQSKDDQIKFLIRTSQELLQEEDPGKLRELVQKRTTEAPRPELAKLYRQQGKIAMKSAKQKNKLAKALEDTAQQTERLTGLMKAAQRMSSTLEAEALETALRQSVEELAEYRRLEWADGNFSQPDILQKARETDAPMQKGTVTVYPWPGFLVDTGQKELVDTLVRIYATCRQNVDTLVELKDSQARLLDSNRLAAVGRLAAGVAHELNTPLGAISVSAEHAMLQLERERGEKAKKNLETILQATKKSQLTIARLSSYTRPQKDKGRTRPVRLAEVVTDAMDLLKRRIKSNEVQVTLDLDEELEARISSIDFYGVVNNLLTNALDAVEFEEPPRTIAVSLRAENGEALLTVEDNGPGIPPELREKVTEPFFTTKEVGRGMGLGLHLCNQFVTQYGGTIQFGESELGGARVLVGLVVD